MWLWAIKKNLKNFVCIRTEQYSIIPPIREIILLSSKFFNYNRYEAVQMLKIRIERIQIIKTAAEES